MGYWRALTPRWTRILGVALGWLLLRSAPGLTAPLAAPEEVLQRARAELNRGEVAAAKATYATLTPGTPQWRQRLEDALRYQLITAQPNEAWRITELARRIGLQSEDLKELEYYRALAAVKARVCVLTQPVARLQWRRLLTAHMYRFASRFQQQGFTAAPFSESHASQLPHYLHALQTNYLSDIPSARLLAGTGCGWSKSRFTERVKAADLEFEELKSWYSEVQAPDEVTRGRHSVELRLLELAVAHKDLPLTKEILQHYVAMNLDAWIATAEPERRYAWQKLIEAGLKPAPPYREGEPEAIIVEAIVMATNTADAAEWMGLLAYETLPFARRADTVKHLLQIEGIPHRPFLLGSQAGFAYQRGDMPAALALIRRLLLQNEAEGEDTIELYVADLAAQIFAEYRYDNSMLGAIQASLPSHTWAKIFRRLAIEHALTGNGAAFERLLLLGAEPGKEGVNIRHRGAATHSAGSLRFDDSGLRLLTALAHRRARDFQAVIDAWQKTARTAGAALNLLTELGDVALQLKDSERQAVQDYLAKLHDYLRGRVATGQSQERLLALIAIFRRDKTDAYGKGTDTVTEGTVRAGVVDLRHEGQMAPPFTWTALTHLPLRDLLVQPVTATDRDWEIR